MCKNRFTACHGRRPSGRVTASHSHRALLTFCLNHRLS
nr:MAG TPA: hypothetical protein [Bacteriophage sp.]